LIVESFTMGTKFTRRQFLAVVSAGATCLALTNTVGCKLLESTSKISPLRTPKMRLMPNASSTSPKGVRAFRSRPDLSPPTVEVDTQAHDTAPGYIFVAPEEYDAGQGGSMIVDNRGQVVWFRPLPGPYGRAMDFKVQSYQGRPVLTWIEQVLGEYVIFDSFYREIARFRAANGYEGDHHEFIISPQDTALITIYAPVRWDLSPVGGPKAGLAWQGIAQELDIETGDVLFEWHSLDHVGVEETYAKPGEVSAYPGIDYFHMNSIDVDQDNNLLISARETSTVYKIDRTTGEVIWRLGGKKSDFEMDPGTRFAYQHDVRRQPDGTITILDNGTTVFHYGIPRAVEEARGIELELDEEKMTAALVREYTHPDKQYADAAGNMQTLPSGNVFIGWGRALVFSEFSKNGELLFDASLPSPIKSYRSFRFAWNGHPSDRPVAVIERASKEEVRIYVSWNGATEVATWEVLAGPSPGQLESLGSVPRDGFETAMLVQTSEPYVAMRAKHRSGRVLGTTEPIKL
jgi:Arylsulfotransferase (ASST)